MKRLYLGCLLAVAALACGNSAIHDDVDARAQSLSASDYCEEIAPFFCEFYLRCGRMAVDSVEVCLPVFLESCNQKYEGAYVDLEAAGLLGLSSSGVAACEAHLDSVACEQQFFELSGPCQGIWDGHQGVGDACGLDTEFFVCDSSSECVLGLDFCGTCRASVEVGEVCTPGEDTCGAAASCIDGLCVARRKNGESCTGANDRCYPGSGCVEGVCEGAATIVRLGDSCDQSHRCPYMSSCVGGTCQASVLVGEVCNAMTTCATGYCEGVCTAPQPNGASCTSYAQCRSGLCTANVCEARPSSCIP